MEEEKEYRVPEYPNKEKGFLCDEQKFGSFSKTLFAIPIYGYICGFLLNIIYLYSWRNNRSIISMAIIFFIDYLLIQIFFNKILKPKKEM